MIAPAPCAVDQTITDPWQLRDLLRAIEPEPGLSVLTSDKHRQAGLGLGFLTRSFCWDPKYLGFVIPLQRSGEGRGWPDQRMLLRV